MSVTINNVSKDTRSVIASAFFYAKRVFHPDDIQYSVRDQFLSGGSVSLTDSESHFLQILLAEYHKNLVYTVEETPKGLDGYRFASSALPLVEDLFEAIGGTLD